MTYCYRCPECGRRYERTRSLVPWAGWMPVCRKHKDPLLMVRDYKAEGANIDRGAFK